MPCPSCQAPHGVEITMNRTGSDQWSGRCATCDHLWTFSDED